MDPARIRQARLAAGLSLADVAGDDVSRTMIHFVEHGRARPSQRVLELIAERTGRPASYFVISTADLGGGAGDDLLSRQLTFVAARSRAYAAAPSLTKAQREAMRLLAANLRQAAAFTKLLESGL